MDLVVVFAMMVYHVVVVNVDESQYPISRHMLIPMQL